MATDRSYPVFARFDRFQVDLSRGELRKEGSSVAIQEQPFQILRMLLQAEGEVVTREELCSALWPKDTFVDSEHGINTAVKKLRQALEDSVERPRYIETLPRTGYRFTAPVEWTHSRHNASPQPNVVPIATPEPSGTSQEVLRERERWKLPVLLAAAALLVIPSALLLRRFVVGHPPPPPAMSQRRLTANPHDAPLTSGVISPDGKFLAYSDPTGLYVRHVDSGETIPVPLPKDLDAMPESWFPDNVHLVASHFDDSEEKPPSLWEISIVGGVPRKLADVGLSARVSPDGSKIAFLKGRWDDEEIWLIETDKNVARKIVDGGGDHFGPVAWAPDGNRFAAVRVPDHFPGQDLVHESKFLMRRQDAARRSCRIFDSAMPLRGRRPNA